MEITMDSKMKNIISDEGVIIFMDAWWREVVQVYRYPGVVNDESRQKIQSFIDEYTTQNPDWTFGSLYEVLEKEFNFERLPFHDIYGTDEY